MKLERILLPTDFSELSERAADIARSLAHLSGATVHVLHVCEPVEITLEAPEIGILRRNVPPDETTLREKLEEFARQHVAEFGVPVVTVLLKGKPAREIARYAYNTRIHRIVIGTHAKGMLRRVLHGSVSKSVLEHAPCAVVMVPPTTDQGRETDIGRTVPWAGMPALS